MDVHAYAHVHAARFAIIMFYVAVIRLWSSRVMVAIALAIFAILIYLSYIATKPPSDVVPLPVLWLVVHNRHVCMLTN